MTASPMGTVARIQPRAEVAAMEGYHSPQVAVSVRLNTNESPFAPPAAWQEALADEVASIDFHRYPDRDAVALRMAIAELHGVEVGQVFAANGSNEVIQTLCLTYGGHGRRVVTFEPTYALHSHIARISGAEVITGQRDQEFRISIDEARRVVSDAQPAVTFLCSPNNPTGLLESQAVIETVANVAPGLVIVDEAYGQFAPWSAQELLSEDRCVAIIRTYSKTWSMAAARLGYLIGPSWLVTELEKVVLPYHLDAVKQAAGRLALRYEGDMRKRVAELVAERDRLVARLLRLDVHVWPSSANFVLFRPLAVDANRVWQALVDRSVLIRNCASWPRLGGCLRVTIGTPEENETFISALTSVLERGGQ